MNRRAKQQSSHNLLLALQLLPLNQSDAIQQSWLEILTFRVCSPSRFLPEHVVFSKTAVLFIICEKLRSTSWGLVDRSITLSHQRFIKKERNGKRQWSCLSHYNLVIRDFCEFYLKRITISIKQSIQLTVIHIRLTCKPTFWRNCTDNIYFICMLPVGYTEPYVA